MRGDPMTIGLPIGGMPISAEEFAALLHRVRRLLDQVRRVADALVARVRLAVRLLPPQVGRQTLTLTGAFAVDLDKLIALLEPLLISPGWPPTLFRTGDAWTERVGRPVSRLSDLASVEQTRVDELWQGPAATAYTQAVAGQAKAFKAVKAAVDEIDDALAKLGGALVVVWAAIVAALLLYVAELAAAAKAAAGVVTAP